MFRICEPHCRVVRAVTKTCRLPGSNQDLKQIICLLQQISSSPSEMIHFCVRRPICVRAAGPLTSDQVGLHTRRTHLNICRGMSSNVKTHYEVLGLSKDASVEDIRAAFLQKSKECHPDMNGSNPDTHGLFVRVNEAYSVLSRPQERKHYDLVMNHQDPLRSAQHGPNYYHHPKGSSEDWLRNSGLREEYFRQNVHYGKTGLNKISNFHIVVACMAFMTVGIVAHIYAVKRSTERHLKNLNDRDLKTHELWMKAKNAAKEFTPRELTQHLIDKQEETKELQKK